MKKKSPSHMLLAFLLLTFGFVSNGQAEPPSTPPGLLEAPPCLEDGLLPSAANVPCNGILLFNRELSKEDRKEIVEGLGATVRFNYNHTNAIAFHTQDSNALSSMIADPDVAEVIPDREVFAFAKPGSGTPTAGQVIPNGVQRIGATPGALSYTGDGIGVAIVDTGLDYNHVDLDLDPSDPCFTAYSSCQDDNNHGTHVGGIVAALNNSTGVVGVAPNARLYAVKVLSASGSGSDANIIAGLDWIADHAESVNPPIRVVNMSLGRFGTTNDNPAMRSVVQTLTNQHGISVVVAAGNDQTSTVPQNVPANYPEVLAVASTTAKAGINNRCRSFSSTIPADTASYFTTDGAFNNSTGIGVSISAPGADQEDVSRNCGLASIGILSLKRGGGTVRFSGTSMATPHVVGVVALMEEAGGPLDPEEVRCRIRKSALRKGIAPLNSSTSSYTFDGEREGVITAGGAISATCP